MGYQTNDVFVLDTESEQVRKVAEGGSLKFMSLSNACVSPQNNQVVALVQGSDCKPHLIEYTLGAKTVKDIHLFT